MAFNLIEGDGGHAGTVPLTVLSKAGLAAWRETAPARERDWAAATGFTGEAGKLALVPDQAGKLGRVLVGASENDAAMWALAGLSEKLPEGNYRLERGPDGGDPTRLALGWALGTLPSPCTATKRRNTGRGLCGSRARTAASPSGLRMRCVWRAI